MTFGVSDNLPVPLLWGGGQMRRRDLIDHHKRKTLSLLVDSERWEMPSMSWLVASSQMKVVVDQPAYHGLKEFIPTKERLVNICHGGRVAHNMSGILTPGRQSVVRLSRHNARVDEGYNFVEVLNEEEVERTWGNKLIICPSASTGEAFLIVQNATQSPIWLPAGSIKVTVKPAIALPTTTTIETSDEEEVKAMMASSLVNADEEDQLQTINTEMINDLYFMWRYSSRPFSIPDWEHRNDLQDCCNTPQYFYSWNMSGLLNRMADREFLPTFESQIKRLKPDIFSLQGLKLQSDPNNCGSPLANSDDAEAWTAVYNTFRYDYEAFLSLATTRTGGQAVFVRRSLPQPTPYYNFGDRGDHHHEGRFIRLDFKDVSVVSVSAPYKGKGSERRILDRRIWDDQMSMEVAREDSQPTPRILMGDFNVTLQDNEASDDPLFWFGQGPQHLEDMGDIGYGGLTTNERVRAQAWVERGDLMDPNTQTHSSLHHPQSEFTWRGTKNFFSKGARFDHFFIDSTIQISGGVKQSWIVNNGTDPAGFMGSDHCPIMLSLQEDWRSRARELRKSFTKWRINQEAVAWNEAKLKLSNKHELSQRGECETLNNSNSEFSKPIKVSIVRQKELTEKILNNQWIEHMKAYDSKEFYKLSLQDRTNLREMFTETNASMLGEGKTFVPQPKQSNFKDLFTEAKAKRKEGSLKTSRQELSHALSVNQVTTSQINKIIRPAEFPEEYWDLVSPEQQALVQGRFDLYKDKDYLRECISSVVNKLDIHNTHVKVKPPWWLASGRPPEEHKDDSDLESKWLRAQALANIDVYFFPDPEKQDFAKDVSAEIHTVDERAFKCKPRKLSVVQQAFLHHKTNIMMRFGKLEHSNSNWCHGLVLVPYEERINAFMERLGDKAIEELFKPEHEAEVSIFFRFCIDLRMLNMKTVPDLFPLPRIDDLLDSIPRNCGRYSISDVTDAFFTCKIAEEFRFKTAFKTHDRHLQFAVLPQGFINSPSIFCRMIARTFQGMDRTKFSAYVDDLLNHTSDFNDHFDIQQEMYNRLRGSALTIKMTKTHLNYPMIKFLGHILTKEGRLPDPEAVEAISAWKNPTTAKEVRSFLGATLYYREYIYQYASMAMPLYELIRKGVIVQQEWKDNYHGIAVQQIKDALTTKPVLMQVDNTKPFRLKIDACRVGRGIGSILEQQNSEGKWQPVSYYSATLSKTERNYSATELECKALHDCILHYATYLKHIPHFEVFSDHNALKYMVNSENSTSNGRLMRYLLDLQGYRFSLYYRKGTENCDADAVSRMLRRYDQPVYLTEDDLDQESGVVSAQMLHRARKLDQRNQATVKEAKEILKNVDGERIKTISRLNDHILSGGVELLDTESGKAEFFENLKKLDISCDEATLRETLHDMELLDQDYKPEKVASKLIDRLTEVELPDLDLDDDDGDEPKLLMKMVNIIHKTEGVSKLNCDDGYVQKFRSLMINNVRDQDSSEDEPEGLKPRKFRNNKNDPLTKMKGDPEVEYRFREDSEILIPYLLTNMVYDGSIKETEVNQRFNGEERFTELRKEIKSRVNDSIKGTVELPKVSVLVGKTLRSGYTLSQDEVIDRPDGRNGVGVEEHKGERPTENRNSASRGSKAKIVYNTRHRKSNAGASQEEMINDRDSETFENEENGDNDVPIDLNKKWHSRTSRRLQHRRETQGLQEEDISQALDVDHPQSNSDDPESDNEVNEQEQELNPESVSEIRNGMEVHKMTLRPKRDIDYAARVRIQPNWRNSEDAEEKHKVHPLDKELQRLKPKSGKGQVEVRVSTIANAGWGLFAKKAFDEGDELCTYEGPIIPENAFNHNYANGDYVAKVVKSRKKNANGEWVNEFIFVDAIMETSCYGRFANDPIEENVVNAKILWNGHTAVIVAQTEIAEGDEIFVCYGREYWSNRLGRLPEKDQELILNDADKCSFDPDVQSESYNTDDSPSDFRMEGTLIPLHQPRDNLLTRFMKRKVIPNLEEGDETNSEEREREEYIFENINECEELATELDQILVGRLFYDEGRLYEVSRVQFDEDYEVIVGWRKPRGARHNKHDTAAFRVFGQEGLYELTERYLLEHPEDLDEVEWPKSNDQWAAEQLYDRKLSHIMNLIRESGGDTIWHNGRKFKMGRTDSGEEALLLRITEDAARGPITQTMVPDHLKKKVLKLHHEGYSHLGINRLAETIRLRYFWSKMDNDIKVHVNDCIPCKLRKTYQSRPKVPIMKYNVANRPLDRVHIDLIGALPRSMNNNRWILVIKDYLTKYVWLVPLRNKSANEVAEAFVNKFVCQAGVPDMVVSDRGNEFVNTLLKNVSKILGVNRVSTTPYNPRSDGFVENHNKTLKDQLYHYIDTLKQDDWDLYLPTVQLLYNTTVSLATGFTPMKLMTGRECRMPSFNHMETIVGNLKPEMLNNEYVRKLVESIKGYHDFAIDQAEKSKLRFNVRVRQPLEFVEYEIGQKFLLIRRPVREFKSADEKEAYKISMKLLERYEGPYVIKEKVSPVVYVTVIDGEVKRVHAVNMKPF